MQDAKRSSHDQTNVLASAATKNSRLTGPLGVLQRKETAAYCPPTLAPNGRWIWRSRTLLVVSAAALCRLRLRKSAECASSLSPRHHRVVFQYRRRRSSAAQARSPPAIRACTRSALCRGHSALAPSDGDQVLLNVHRQSQWPHLLG